MLIALAFAWRDFAGILDEFRQMPRIWLVVGSDPSASALNEDVQAHERYLYALTPQWHPIALALSGLLLLATMIAGSVALARSSVEDYYRLSSGYADPKWESFVRRQSGSRD